MGLLQGGHTASENQMNALLSHIKRLASSGLLCSMGLLLFASGAVAQTVKVGLLLPMSGPVAAIGESVNRGVLLYQKLHQASLPNGLKVDIILRDDAGSPDNIRRVAQELAVRDKVQLFIGGAISPQVVSLTPFINQSKLPLIVVNASTASLTRLSPYMVRVATTLWQTSYTMGVWAAKKGYSHANTLVADYTAGLDAEAAFIEGFSRNGGTMVGKTHTPLATADYLPYMQSIKDSGARTLFIFLTAGRVNSAINAVIGSGLTKSGVRLVGPGDTAFDDELAKMNDNVVGLVTAGIYYVGLPNPGNKAFVAAWKKEYGDDAIPNSIAVAGWDATAAAYDLVRVTKGNFTSETAMKFLSTWKPAASPRGEIYIDPQTRDIVQSVHINRVELVAGKPTNVNVDKIDLVKDPWKEQNPEKR